MTSLAFALALLCFELLVFGLLALVFGERLRTRLFRRRNNSKAFASAPEDKSSDVARALIALHGRLGETIVPVNIQDPRPAARELAQQAIGRAMQTLGKEGVCDSLFAQELLTGCERLAAALDQLPVIRETITIQAPQPEAPAPPRESILKSILMESETQHIAPDDLDQHLSNNASADPLNYAMNASEL